MMRLKSMLNFISNSAPSMDCMSRESSLVVAAWGYPQPWRPFRYRLESAHPAFRDRLKHSCISRSSTVALVSALQKIQERVKCIIFGLDTVVQPEESGDLRTRAEEFYRGWVEKLISGCECCSSLDPSDFQVVVLPGKGEFHGWRYMGSVDHMFNKVFDVLTNTLTGDEFAWIHLDLTHGLNYQMLAVLYGAISSVVAAGRETRLLMYNSTPPPPQRKGRNDMGMGNGSSLDLLDVTRLREAVGVVRALESLRNLSTAELGRAVGDLERSGVEEARKLAEVLKEDVKRFIDIFRSGAVALTYPRSTAEGRPLVRHICEIAEELGRIGWNTSYPPTVKPGEKVVEYPPATIYQSIRKAVALIMRDFCGNERFRRPGGLIEYMEACRKILVDRGFIAQALQVGEEVQALRNVAMYASSIGIRAVDAELYALLTCGEKKHQLGRWVRGEGEPPVVEENEIERHREDIRVRRERNVGEQDLRNLTAHAGLEYTMLSSMILGGRDIEEVNYHERIFHAIGMLIDA